MITRSRFSFAWLAVMILMSHASVYALQSQDSRQKGVPSPRDVLGFAPGEDRKLAGWSQMVDYFKRLDSASDRVTVHQPGITTERRPFIVAIISSEENIRDLARIR